MTIFLEVMFFNVVLNKSNEWGVMPFLWWDQAKILLFVPNLKAGQRQFFYYAGRFFAYHYDNNFPSRVSSWLIRFSSCQH